MKIEKRTAIREPRSAALLCVLCVSVAAFLAACGVLGGGQTGDDTFSGATGRVVITILWPQSDAHSRFIPAATQSVKIRVFKGTVELVALRTIVPRPAGQTQTTVTIDNVPIGLTRFDVTAHMTADGTGTVLATGSGEVTTVAGATVPLSIVLSLAIGQIAFASDRDGNNEIYVMNEDGTGQTNLTNTSADEVSPAWSPDGSKIAFRKYTDIYVMNVGGTGLTQLTNTPSSDGEPAWSPDGTKIAFTSFRDGNYEIYLMNAEGSSQMNLTNNPLGDYSPAWSPDGTKIAFASDRDGGSWRIYVMNTDGTGQASLSNNGWNPAWSPDGAKIAFVSDRDGNREVYVMNADGTGQTRLTNNSYGDYEPTWSPDGTKIAFGSDRDGNYEVYVMNSDGTAQTNLTSNPAGDLSPAWTAAYGSADVSVTVPN